MIRHAIRHILAVAMICSFHAAPPAEAQVGPDVVTSDLTDLRQFGREGPIGSGTVGLAMEMTACNLGDQTVEWFALPDTNHPMLLQNLYRLKLVEGSERFEQIGLAWLKHGHGAAQQPDCSIDCQPFSDGTQLGVGCADTYGAGQQANPCQLGPRSILNPYTGAMPGGDDLGPGGGCDGGDFGPFSNFPAQNHIGHTHDGLSHRLQVPDVDLMPALNPGARYFAEAQYMAPHEFVAGNGNQHNNASYREYLVSGPNPAGVFVFEQAGSVVSEAPAVNAWSGASRSIIEPAPLLDGRAILAHRVTDLGSGLWHYEYAVYNMNLDRSIGSLGIPVPAGVTVSGVGFHAPLNHAPELHADNYANDPWEATITPDSITWSTSSFGDDPLANAVRFGTLYSFRFDANAPPRVVEATVEMFKTDESLTVPAEGPAPIGPQDCNNNGIDDRCDLDCDAPGCGVAGCGQAQDCTANGIPDECEPDCNDDGLADRCEFASGQATDCNVNTVPDACEPGGEFDCNANAQPDFCDILLGTSEDANTNGVPDECEATDRTWYVDDDNCPGPGSGAITSPFCTIQTAIDASVSGDTIIVMDGLYRGPGNRELDFGGRSITLRSQNGPANCTLDGERVQYVVRFTSGETADARVEGFTIVGGFDGVRCSLSSPTISRCTFVTADRGVVCTNAAAPTIIDCDFRPPRLGTGIDANEAGPIRVISCRFAGHLYGIRSQLSNVSVSQTIIEVPRGGGFRGPNYGIRCFVFPCVINVSDSVITGGSQTIGITGNLVGTISNTTIAGHAVGLASGPSVIVRNCVVWNNVTQISAFPPGLLVEYSNIEHGWPGTGNIDVDPLFVDPENGDYHLSPDSPSINAGDPAFIDTGSPDIDGEPRVAGGRVDMGADEYHDCNGNVTPDYLDIRDGASADCDGNARPDECEDTSTDCNANGVWDPCDIAEATSADCQANGVPDECDIAVGLSQDCTGNGIPDECEPDCNHNRVADTCDLTRPGGEDCNANLVLDECEVEVGTGLDCNANLVPDDCDVSLGTSPDLNENGLPDECEVSPPLIAAPPHDRRKNRFFSIGENNPTIETALRIELLDLACSAAGEACSTEADCPDGETCAERKVCTDGILAGQPCMTSADCDLQGPCETNRVMLGWVGEPFEPGTEQTPAGTFTSLVVKDQPPPRAWTEDVVHIGDCEVAPARTYAISATVDGLLFSQPLIIGTIKKPEGKFWADVVGEFDGTEWTAPNGLVNVNDIIAWINFVTFKPAPHITALDLANEMPNFIINATDLGLILQAFQSRTYPPPAFANQGGPADCP